MSEILILTGAGVSAESGLGTFRDVGGLWDQYDLEEVATPEGFARNPALVHEFYNLRRDLMQKAEPNAAHRALAKLEREIGDRMLIITQNIDDLHERAGSKRVLHMHGRLANAFCAHCGSQRKEVGALSVADACASCRQPGGMRPDVVWFGEIPHHLEEIDQALGRAELFVSIGASGQVYPAAGFVAAAQRLGAETLELNMEATSTAFNARKIGPATEIVPTWVDEILSR
ncbi:MAG: NAD-dependent deacylase [Pseudomonadota bacterium]